MDYLIKTKIGSWKIEDLYSHYKQNSNNSQDAQVKLKSDLNDLINSELTSDKAKKFLKSLLEKSKVNYVLKVKTCLVLLTHAFRHVYRQLKIRFIKQKCHLLQQRLGFILPQS